MSHLKKKKKSVKFKQPSLHNERAPGLLHTAGGGGTGGTHTPCHTANETH